MTASLAPLPGLKLDHPCIDCGVRNLSLCGALGSEALQAFKASGPTVRYDAGEIVAFEADLAAHVYTVTAGLLRLSKLLFDGRRQIVGFLFPGDFLGITMEDRHAFTAEAVTPTTLCKFGRRRFDEYVSKHPALERRLFTIASRDLAAARQQLVLIGRKSAPQRLASFLLMLARRSHSGSGVQDVNFHMSRADIADYLGLRIETVSREISSLKIARVIQLTGRQSFRIIDRPRLEHLTEGFVAPR